MEEPVLKFKTIILSDVHLGAHDCKVKEVNHFLEHSRCEKMILNGDIIDGWRLSRKGGWTKEHTRFVRLVLKKLERENTQVIYLRGNHDDMLGRFLPMSFGGLEILEEYIHVGADRKYLVFHGDVFDAVTTNLAFLARMGAVGYEWLLTFNRLYNRYRALRGKEYYSVSKMIKARVKKAVNFISNFEEAVAALAVSRECAGAICGHIHTPDDKMINGIHYMNSGDWVESLTAIVEDADGRLNVLAYPDFCAQLERSWTT